MLNTLRVIGERDGLVVGDGRRTAVGVAGRAGAGGIVLQSGGSVHVRYSHGTDGRRSLDRSDVFRVTGGMGGRRGGPNADLFC